MKHYSTNYNLQSVLNSSRQMSVTYNNTKTHIKYVCEYTDVRIISLILFCYFKFPVFYFSEHTLLVTHGTELNVFLGPDNPAGP